MCVGLYFGHLQAHGKNSLSSAKSLLQPSRRILTLCQHAPTNFSSEHLFVARHRNVLLGAILAIFRWPQYLVCGWGIEEGTRAMKRSIF